jgi:pyruvate,water dikinase
MSKMLWGLEELDRTQLAIAGGKGAALGELSRIEEIRVPAGFCVTTEAFRRALAGAPSIDPKLDRLRYLSPDDREELRTLSEEIRRVIEAIAVPEDLSEAITTAVARLGEHPACAVRSSANAEDLPAASFAGQQDTYLNVVGATAVIRHVSRCWASLFSERAVTYRLQNGFDHRKVHMAVFVQQMVFPETAGALFTADPVTSNRKIVAVEASYGLGEAVVSGRVNADVYRVRDDEIVEKTVGIKKLAVCGEPAGGTREEAVDPQLQSQPVLTDAQVLRLAQLGRRIEGHFGLPQDIEWCLVDDRFWIVKSRPITTLFPIPALDDQQSHVFLSVGHAQMMTDAMKPLGISFWQLSTPRPMHVAGGRLFVDVASELAEPARRANLLEVMGKSDPLIRDALETLLGRPGFLPALEIASPTSAPISAGPPPMESDPDIVTGLIEESEASIAKLRSEIRGKSGAALFEFILSDIQELRRVLFDPHSHRVFMSAMEATWWLNGHLEAWLGVKNAADALSQSVPHNVTSEMGLALLDVADVIRPFPEVVALLRDVEDEDLLDELAQMPGGKETRDAISAFLEKYGMRCVGEIDITRPRWSERPTTLVPLILNNIEHFEKGAGNRLFEKGLHEAQDRERELLARLADTKDGQDKVDETKRRIDRLRAFMGYREYPKYGMVSRYFVYKQALLEESGRLVQAGVLRETEDIYYLTFQELQDVVRSNHSDDELISQRKDSFRLYQTLTPPRVSTSDGEVIFGAYRRRDEPNNALVGLPVSAGAVEGRARVIASMGDADLEPGDILVTAYTDPSWTAVFVGISGLVTEVGGHMTHGAVIAREYGLPAVVGVEGATRLIADGQRIRVDGTHGYIELLS